MANAAESYAAQFGLGVISGNSTATTRYDFRSVNLGLHEQFIDANGLRGTTSRVIERNLQGNRPCMGSVHMQPTAVEWSNILQWIMGGTPTGNTTVTYPLADTRPVRSCVIDRVTKVDTYATTGVESWTLSGSEGAALDLNLNLVALDESEGNAATFPALNLDITTFPFKFTDCVVNCNSTAYLTRDFNLSCDYHVDKTRFFNQQTLTGIFSLDRTVTFTANMPDCDAHTLYNIGRAGFSVVITATTGNSVLIMTLVACATPRLTPPVPERREIMFPLVGQAFRSGTTLELVTSLNATP